MTNSQALIELVCDADLRERVSDWQEVAKALTVEQLIKMAKQPE